MQQRPVYIHIQQWEQSKKYSALKESLMIFCEFTYSFIVDVVST